MHHDAVQIPWQPVKTRRASEEIYLQLREFILSGQLKPGDRLPSERAMMAQLNRSRPTIREALRMLEQGGYIASTHGAGAVVQEPSLHGVEEPLAEMIQLNQISLQELGEYRLNNDSTIAMWAAQRRSAAPARPTTASGRSSSPRSWGAGWWRRCPLARCPRRPRRDGQTAGRWPRPQARRSSARWR